MKNKKIVHFLLGMFIVFFGGLIVGLKFSERLPEWNVVATIMVVVTFAWGLIQFNIKEQRESSKLFMEQALVFFERSYNQLVNEDGILHNPGDRLRWNTCARYLNSANGLEKSIKDDVFLQIYKDMSHYYSDKFSSLLSDDDNPLNVSYFRESSDKIHGYKPGDQSPLDLSAVENIFSFSLWPNDKVDNIDTSKKDLDYFETTFVSQRGLRDYAKEYLE